MSRISEALAATKGLIPFITAGDPDLPTTRSLIIELADAGAAVIELGVPFSDPVADGPTIQRASQRALRNEINLEKIFEIVREARKETHVPIVLFSYFNPLLQFGLKRLGAEAKRSGVDGVLVTDLAPEDSNEIGSELTKQGLDQIFLAAPTSTDERLQLIAERTTGFVYAVSRTGVTGVDAVGQEAEQLVKRIRAVTDKPVAVGFGISNHEHVKDVWRYADAAVVGSAVVAEIEKQIGSEELVKQIGNFVRELQSPEQLVRGTSTCS